MTCPTARALIEGWRPCVFKGQTIAKYECHFDGRVRNAKTQRVLAPVQCKSGTYRKVSLYLGSRNAVVQAPIHQLVCETWQGPPPLGMPQVVDHIDNRSTRNVAQNLRWLSYSMNTRQWYAWQGRLREYGEAAGEHLHRALSTDEHAAFLRTLDAPGW